ncbi:hypothetical protein CCUS01_01843 [Colletotrichum cuscutae]|uniref:Uncharacterized protein n=1 Tax=Colletotrichum cuscutae TaxID=1209917 RepID=A0AAI9U6W6_9PEZI|nr:hypothetical protein CCUS01_01843 [Colletotrichum cuscutae]
MTCVHRAIGPGAGANLALPTIPQINFEAAQSPTLLRLFGKVHNLAPAPHSDLACLYQIKIGNMRVLDLRHVCIPSRQLLQIGLKHHAAIKGLTVAVAPLLDSLNTSVRRQSAKRTCILSDINVTTHANSEAWLSGTKPRSFAPPPGTILKLSISRVIHCKVPPNSRRIWDSTILVQTPGCGTAPMMAHHFQVKRNTDPCLGSCWPIHPKSVHVNVVYAVCKTTTYFPEVSNATRPPGAASLAALAEILTCFQTNGEISNKHFRQQGSSVALCFSTRDSRGRLIGRIHDQIPFTRYSHFLAIRRVRAVVPARHNIQCNVEGRAADPAFQVSVIATPFQKWKKIDTTNACGLPWNSRGAVVYGACQTRRRGPTFAAVFSVKKRGLQRKVHHDVIAGGKSSACHQMTGDGYSRVGSSSWNSETEPADKTVPSMPSAATGSLFNLSLSGYGGCKGVVFPLLILDISTCCLVWSFAPTAVTIAAPQHVEADVPTGGKETRAEFFQKAAQCSYSMDHIGSMSRIDPALHVVVKVEPSSVKGEHGGTMYATVLVGSAKRMHSPWNSPTKSTSPAATHELWRNVGADERADGGKHLLQVVRMEVVPSKMTHRIENWASVIEFAAERPKTPSKIAGGCHIEFGNAPMRRPISVFCGNALDCVFVPIVDLTKWIEHVATCQQIRRPIINVVHSEARNRPKMDPSKKKKRQHGKLELGRLARPRSVRDPGQFIGAAGMAWDAACVVSSCSRGSG